MDSETHDMELVLRAFLNLQKSSENRLPRHLDGQGLPRPVSELSRFEHLEGLVFADVDRSWIRIPLSWNS